MLLPFDLHTAYKYLKAYATIGYRFFSGCYSTNNAHDAVTCDEWQTTALLTAGN